MPNDGCHDNVTSHNRPALRFSDAGFPFIFSSEMNDECSTLFLFLPLICPQSEIVDKSTLKNINIDECNCTVQAEILNKGINKFEDSGSSR